MELTEEQKRLIEETITNKDGVYSCESVAGRGSLYIERCSASKRGKLAHNKGKRLMNNGINYKYVNKMEVDKHLAEGWVLGFMRRRKGAK